MIEPISLRIEVTTLTIEPHFACSADKTGDKVRIETFVINSGRLKGAVIAYVRHLPDTTDIEYPWQVIKQRDDANRLHYSTVKTLEQALNLVMACAYEYVAFN